MEETVNDFNNEPDKWEVEGIDSWHPMSREEDRLPYSLANVLKPHPLLRWAFYVAVGAAVALFITLLLL